MGITSGDFVNYTFPIQLSVFPNSGSKQAFYFIFLNLGVFPSFLFFLTWTPVVECFTFWICNDFPIIIFRLNIFSKNTSWLMLSSSCCIRSKHIMSHCSTLTWWLPIYCHTCKIQEITWTSLQKDNLRHVMEGIALGNEGLIGWGWERNVDH